MKLRFQWGPGTGYLCAVNIDSANTYRLKLDSNLAFAPLFNNPYIIKIMDTSVKFNVDTSGKYITQRAAHLHVRRIKST